MSSTNFNGKNNATDNSGFNLLDFHIDYRLSLLNTMKICKVIKNHGNNVCDVKPLTCEVDNNGNNIEPPVLQKLPSIKTQGGLSGVVIEYQPGDIVYCGFADRDINPVQKTRSQSAPVTRGTTPLNSGVILGALLVNAPNIYVKITDQIYLTGAAVIISESLQVAKDISTNGNLSVAQNAAVMQNLTVGGTIAAGGAISAPTLMPTNGASGMFTDTGTGASGKTLTITNGIITGIN